MFFSKQYKIIVVIIRLMQNKILMLLTILSTRKENFVGE